MKNKFLFSILIIVSLNTLITYSSEWDYKRHGPDTWPEEYNGCDGMYQSPINIDKSVANYDENLKLIEFNNYDIKLFWNISNNGHTIVSNQIYVFNEIMIPYIKGSNFDEKFYLAQFHFHWGYNIFQGSEHFINDKKYPLELHLVHKSKSNKLAVIGFLFQISESDNPGLDTLLNAVRYDVNETTYKLIRLKLNSILPDLTKIHDEGYFRYMGSLTTPPCTEGVIWTVYNMKVNISEAQIQSFYSNQIELNYRDVQKVFNRTVYISIPNNVTKQCDN